MPFVKKLELNDETPKEVVNRLLLAINRKFASKWLDNPGELLRLTPKVEETKEDRLVTTILGNDPAMLGVLSVIVLYFQIDRLHLLGLDFIERGDRRELDIQRNYPGIARLPEHKERLDQVSEEWTTIIVNKVSASSSHSSSSSSAFV
mmetsp:Transcript_6200/g.10321  ORF Transcript_6200/g.10321 Transcript_6200/m.10321 type:complete len:148 (+) Transcript_6200:191-634(+)